MNDRELEKKWIVNERPERFAAVSATLGRYMLDKAFVGPDRLLYADTIDNYWRGAENAKADIVRLRHSWGHTQDGQPRSLKEFTVKHKDRGCNFDRLELNNSVDSVESFRRSLNLALGTPLFTLRKDELVAFLPAGIVVSLALVESDASLKRAIVFEIEGPEANLIQSTEEMFKARGLFTNFELTQLSLLEMFDEKLL